MIGTQVLATAVDVLKLVGGNRAQEVGRSMLENEELWQGTRFCAKVCDPSLNVMIAE